MTRYVAGATRPSRSVRAAGSAGIPVVLHGGGLWDQPVHAPEAKRRMMRATDGRIADLTGQVFGAAYLDGLLVHPDTVWYSRPTIAAVLAAGQMRDVQDLTMLTAIQRAHYVDGTPGRAGSGPGRHRGRYRP